MAVPVDTGEEFDHGSPQALMEWPYLFPGPGSRTYDAADDGRFLALKPVGEEGRSRFIIVENWIEELQERVPVGN